MFNLEKSIAEWRRQMVAAGVKSPAPLEELESHLCDDVQEKVRSGMGEAQAFQTAVSQMGHAEIVQNEFKKARAGVFRRWRRLVLNFAGVSAFQPVTTMNTMPSAPNLESRRASYLRAATVALPAALMWMFTVIFVAPKLQEVCLRAGRPMFDFGGASGIFRGLAAVGQGLFILTQYRLFIGAIMVIALALLEWRSERWPRYRRLVLGTGSFALNLTVLIAISMMVISALLVAMQNLPHGK